jgi:hypothetical protein
MKHPNVIVLGLDGERGWKVGNFDLSAGRPSRASDHLRTFDSESQATGLPKIAGDRATGTCDQGRPSQSYRREIEPRHGRPIQTPHNPMSPTASRRALGPGASLGRRVGAAS